MNLISTLVGISVAGASMPMMMQMSIAPFEAEKRASNLGLAESSAVTYAAVNEGSASLTALPAGCAVTSTGSAHIVTCTEGTGTRFVQSVTRAFRTDTGGSNANNDGSSSNSGDGSSVRTFDYLTPQKYSGIQCPVTDQWGVYGYNDRWADLHDGWCIPYAAWAREWYLASNPDDWMYDIDNYNGWGHHPDY